RLLSCRSRHHPALPSFPTRRSSDLIDSTKGWMTSLARVPSLRNEARRRPATSMAREFTRSPRGVSRPNPPHKERRAEVLQAAHEDRKSTRLNSSHVKISYAVFCLKK